MDIETLWGGFFENLIVFIIGFTILGLNWKELFARLSFVSLCTVLLSIVLNQFDRLISLPILVIISCLIIYWVMNIKFISALAAFLCGVVTFLSIQAILFYTFPQFTDSYIYGLTIGIVFIFIFLAGKLRSNISRPNKIVVKANTENSTHTEFKWMWIVLLITTLSISYLVLFYSMHLSNREEQIILAIPSFVFIIVGIYIFKQNHDGHFKQLELSINKQFDKQLNQYVELINTQRYVTVDHLLKTRMMLEIGQLQKSKDYLDHLIDELTLAREVAPIKSDATAGILLAFKDFANQKNIELTLDIQDDLSDLPCESYETHQLLKSLLQLIIDSSEKVSLDKRKIQLKISKINNEFLIESHYIEAIDTKDITITKDEQKDLTEIPHNIKDIVNKYKGHITSEITNRYLHIKIDIPILMKGRGKMYDEQPIAKYDI